MSITKRGNTYWVRFRWRGKEIRRSARTYNRAQAEAFEAKLKADLYAQTEMGKQPARTWQDAIVRYVPTIADQRSRSDTMRQLRYLNEWLEVADLSDIDRSLCESIRDARKAQGVANGTVNRMLAALSAVLHKCHGWGWISKTPQFDSLPEPKKRVRFLTRTEADRLLEELPEHLRAMAAFTLTTGLRMSNVTGLEWSQIDLQRRVALIYADQIKGKKDLPVPLNNDAVVVLRGQIGKHRVRVFTYKGSPVTKANTKAWEKALVRAGINDFRWHDLRHTWASWHAQNGTTPYALMELGGWSSLEMVEKYGHLGESDLADQAQNVSRISRPKTGSLQKEGKKKGGAW